MQTLTSRSSASVPRASASEMHGYLWSGEKMMQLAQIGEVVLAHLSITGAYRHSSIHGSAMLGVVSSLAQMAWLQFRAKAVSPGHWYALGLSIGFGLCGTAITNLPPYTGLGVTLLRATVGLRARLLLPLRGLALKQVTILPTSRLVFGERLP